MQIRESELSRVPFLSLSLLRAHDAEKNEIVNGKGFVTRRVDSI